MDEHPTKAFRSKPNSSISKGFEYLAKGKIDVALSFTKKNDWDLAASDLILREAGGNIKKMNGEA